MWNIEAQKFCVAISGLSGCGNTTICTWIANRFNITMINYTFRNLAKEHNMDFETLCQLAEKDDTWDLMLDKKQVELASQESCVVGSRLAIWVIPQALCRVYLEAPLSIRAQRIANREGKNLETITTATYARDEADYKRYKKLYNIDIHNYRDQADVIIDTETLSVEGVGEKIVSWLSTHNFISKGTS